VPETLQITLPALGESVTEGMVAEWRKHEGDHVDAGEVIVDVTTDKVDVEVPSPAEGRLSRILVQAGQTVAVGASLAELVVGATAGAATPGPNGGKVPAIASPDTAAPPTSDVPPPPPSASPVELTLPNLGESVTEGLVARWVKTVGDRVTRGEPVVDITSDKVDVEVPAPVSGVLSEIRVAEGATAAVGTILGVILEGAAEEAAASTAPPPPVLGTETAQAATRPASVVRQPPGVRASPLARRAAALAGIDLGAVQGTGPGGLVRRDDVRAAAASPADAEAAQAGRPSGEVVVLQGPAAALAAAMEESRSIPTATSIRTIAVDVLDARRGELNAALKAAGRPEKVSFTHLIGFAVARATPTVPSMSAHFERNAEGRPLRVQPGIHLGLAANVTRKDGSRFLMVPVIRNATTRSFADFRDEYERLLAKARTGTLTVDEMKGASLTLTNPGGIGTVASVPRLMPGQGTIVAVGAIGYPPGLKGINEARLRDLGVSKVMTLTSTYDHRIIQGAESGEFLAYIERLLRGDDGFYATVFADLGLAPPSAESVPPELTEEAAAVVRAPQPLGYELLAAVSSGMSLVRSYRTHGHLRANLDPLGIHQPPGDPSLDPDTYGLTPALMRAVPAEVLRVHVPGETLADVLPHLQQTYCGTIAYEIEHISPHEQRRWLREQIEGGRHRAPLSPERRLQLLQRLTRVEAMERYLRRAFLGHQTFSIEGLDVMVPMLEELLASVADDGISRVIMGMAHRGRLAVTAHVVNRPYESILATFEQGEQKHRFSDDDRDPTGDVKYHLGAEGTYVTESGKKVSVLLPSNPSHLEAVDPVIEGWTRAEQTRRHGAELHLEPKAALPVLIHGDAAFPAQGIVAEVLNLESIPGYDTGGTVHLIANNQIGFTTNPEEGRSTRYASDLAKGFDIPVIHVNADDVEACISAIRLAYEYLRTYHRDVVIDLVGYRRSGHNEADEPSYTQPLMSRAIKEHPSVRELYAQRLVDEGQVSKEDVDAQAQEAYRRVGQAHERVKASLAAAPSTDPPDANPAAGALEVATGVPAETLTALNEQLLSLPPDFHVNPKLLRQMERRRQALKDGEVDWATAESLALASLLLEGHPVRLTGQDTERGAFSQRHLRFHDVESGKTSVPVQHLVGATATFELHNSPLSEVGVVGFEYGYSVAAPEALVVWEAQYGDFINNAQVIVDEFISSGMAKWSQKSRLTLLLPHGYEGSGPDHSSGRLERFLQLSANGNIRVANCSSAAQYFHLLRCQAREAEARPLVIMTPKWLLRLHEAGSALAELTHGRFQRVIDDPGVSGRREEVTTLLLCSGKIYYELFLHPQRAEQTHLAIARIELLAPLPTDEVMALIESYPHLSQVFWVQEEPANMGAWYHLARRIGRRLPRELKWEYIGRPTRASPSEGFRGAHQLEQERIVTTALRSADTVADDTTRPIGGSVP
jgi:multifunctional 2-oxoglutarate metabolism enzyme